MLCIKNGTLHTAVSKELVLADILIDAGKIVEIAPQINGSFEKMIPLKAHAHQANDIFNAIRVAKEFGLDITLEHVTEGHLIVDELVKENFLYNFASSNIHYIAPALFFPRWGLVYRI